VFKYLNAVALTHLLYSLKKNHFSFKRKKRGKKEEKHSNQLIYKAGATDAA